MKVLEILIGKFKKLKSKCTFGTESAALLATN